MRYYFLKPVQKPGVAPDPLLTLSVSPTVLNLTRQPPGITGSFQIALSNPPRDPLPVTLTSSDPSITLAPASFLFNNTNYQGQTVTVTGLIFWE